MKALLGIMIFTGVMIGSLGWSQDDEQEGIASMKVELESDSLNQIKLEKSKKEEERSPDSVRPVDKVNLPEIKSNLLSSGIEEQVFDGVTNLEGAAARKKLTEEAMQSVSEQLAQGYLGEARYKKYKKVIQDKIFRYASRYIPVIKIGEMTKTPEGQKMRVSLQVNSKMFERMLLENNLLYENETALMMIPFLRIEDQVRGLNYRWWHPQTTNSNLKSISKYLELQLQDSLFKKGFYVQKPEWSLFHLLVPVSYQQDLLTPEQIQTLASRWNIPLAFSGDLVIKKNFNQEISLELRAYVIQVNTGRVLAQLYRQNTLPKNENLESLNLKKGLSFVVQAYSDLGQQMMEAWQRGILTSTLVRLELQSPLPINKYELFKEALKSANRSIRQVRERLITSQSVLFELEINGSLNDVASSLKQLKVGDIVYRYKGLDAQNRILLSNE